MAEGSPTHYKGLLAWFAHNSVAANLLMAAVVIIGLVVAGNIRQEVYPEFALDAVEIEMEYRGSSPEEVERSIILPIEGELRGMEIVHKLTAIASEGRASIEVELTPGTDRNRGLQEITAAVQRISLFPDDAELPVIALDAGRRREVIRLAISGDLDEGNLVRFARQLERGLLADPQISLVDFYGLRRPEISIEIPQGRLRSLGLTLEDVARAIDAAALDVPAGTMRTPSGDYLLRTKERRDFASQFASIPVVSNDDGSRVYLSSIAKLEDGFEESESEAYFNGRRSLFISVFSGEKQSPVEVASAVKAFVAKQREILPPSVGIVLSRDRSDDYQQRVSLLLRNGALGLLLVLLGLGLFLELRVAFWTAIGIPISILGSLALLPLMGASINMLSLFGFIVTLGIVVDDAVVVGEEIYHQISRGIPRLQAAVIGVRRMAMPVTFAVITNIVAFLPLLFVPGQTGKFFEVLPAVVIAVFTVSLIECFFILPAHLGHLRDRVPGIFARIDAKQNWLRTHLEDGIERIYAPLLRAAVNARYLTVAFFFTALIIVFAYVWSGRIDFAFRPTIETDFIQAEIEMPTGTPVKRTREVAFQVEAAARRAIEQLEKDGEGNLLIGVYNSIARRSSNEAEVSVILVPQDERNISGENFANVWREAIGEIPDVESLFFDYLIGPGGSAEIDVQLAHPEVEVLRAAATDLAAAIDRFPGVEDINKGFGRAMPQFDFEITPEGRSLGLTARELGRQIRHAFYGAEALRQPRDRDELRVMVRLPMKDRRSLSSLQTLLIRTPDGGEIALNQAAKIIPSEAPVRIERIDGGRVVNVTGNVIPGITNANKVLKALKKSDLPDILAKYPGLNYSFEGGQREQREAMVNLSWGLLASLFIIYALMASLLGSHAQALIVLLTLPWGLAGAVVGHVLMGFDLSIFSVFGMIALCGMVVNGAFVLTIARNEMHAQGKPMREANLLAAQRRFRPIFLTSVTTFAGLAPMIFETSMQALFLVPMAISLGVGTLVSAFVVLFLIPAVIDIMEDFRGQEAMPTL